MNRQNEQKRIWNCFFAAVLGLLLWGPAAGGGQDCDCLPEFPVEEFSLVQASKRPLVQSLLEGDFETAETLLDCGPDPNSPFACQVRSLLATQRRGQQQWQERDLQHLRQLREQIEAARAAAEQSPPARPEEILSLLAQMRQRSDLTEPNARDDAFASILIEQVRQRIENWQSHGEYEKAWRYGFRTLFRMNPEDPEIGQERKHLLRKVSIEYNLTPIVCPGQPDPYAKVRAEVLYRALVFLHERYVSPVNYSSLIEAAVDYAGDVGEALASGREDFLYRADPNRVLAWNTEIALMRESSPAGDETDFLPGLCVQRIQRILELNKRTLRLPEGFLVHGLAEVMLGELDPYTEIVWPSQSDEFDKQMTGEFAGVGIRITLDGKKLKILEVVSGTPAAESGRLKADDWITAIDGTSTMSLPLTCAVRQISGPEGSPVVLTIDRDGQEEDVALHRRRIVLPTLHGTAANLSQPTEKQADLSAYRIDRDPRIGYLWISSFKPETASALRGLLQQLEAQRLIGLVLDLRSNSGGLLESASSVADLFLTEGLIVKSRTREGTGLVQKAKPDQLLKDIPLVILIDGSTASGAEIVAGALTDPGHRRALLVGSRTYGKGSIQEVETMASDGSRMKYTRAFYTLSGDRPVANRYQLRRQGRTDWGLEPDVEAVVQRHQAGILEQSRRDLRQFYAERAQSGEEALSEQELELLDSLVQSDPQLATGLTILKAQILAAGIELQNQQDYVRSETVAQSD